ncbi:LuxR C-terminal-related transcriptional regulator [Sphingobium lactosutens]|uniref:LuxR C-terminal-related transcriptional regulator n=1 Tax=Sphingobium lactosutens TaxID=522773 RepID=UPI0015B86A75|nr:LuxR C-terminal-related transcriptional regulator [Sphingobium lactosutens]
MTDLSQLSATQRQILQLVADGVTASKDIGRVIDKSPATIDVYLSKAAASLGANGRHEAARKFKELSQLDSKFRMEDIAETEGIGLCEDAGSKPASRSSKLMKKLFPPIGGPTDELTPLRTLGLIIQLSLITAVSTAVVVVIYLWVMDQFAELAR